MPCPAHLSAHAVGPAQLCMADLFQALLPSPAHTCTKAGVFPPTNRGCASVPMDRQAEHALCHVQINLYRSCAVDGLSEPRSAVLSSLPLFSNLCSFLTSAPAEGSLASDQDLFLNGHTACSCPLPAHSWRSIGSHLYVCSVIRKEKCASTLEEGKCERCTSKPSVHLQCLSVHWHRLSRETVSVPCLEVSTLGCWDKTGSTYGEQDLKKAETA